MSCASPMVRSQAPTPGRLLVDKKQARKRAAGWLLVIGVLVVLVALVPLTVNKWDATTAEWSQAVIQALAALGGLWFWLYRSRPRVVLRLKSNNGLYLELANVGSRAAKKVEMRVDPPIPWKTTLGLAPREQFGPVEDFGDMDQGQRYVVLVGSPVPHTVDVLNGLFANQVGVRVSRRVQLGLPA